MIFTKFPTAANLFNQFRNPLFLNGYALVLGSGTASILGIIYWIFAARLYPAEVVGVDTAVLSAVFFLANVAQLNLVHALNRFIPSAGRGTLRLIVSAYLISAFLALAASAVFLLGLEIWTPSLTSITSSSSSTIWFVIATISWCIFTLQDGVLVGLRQAKWVPFSTIAYALIKLGLIVLFATLFPTNGVLMSWTLPVLLLIVPMSIFIFSRLVPAHVQTTQHLSQTFTLGDISRFVAGNYVSSFIWMATVTLLPIIILERLGATHSAHFYLAWNVAYALYFVSINMGMSLVTEGSREPENLNYYGLQTLKQTLRLIVPVIVVVLIGAPYILHLFGASYAANDVMLLRTLSLSAIPYVFVLIHISMARVRREVLKILFTYTGLCVAVLLFSHIFIGLYGLEGVGFAWVVGQSLVVAVLLATDLRKAWSPYLRLPGYSKGMHKVPFMVTTAPFRNRNYHTSAQKILPLITRRLSLGAPKHAWRVGSIIANNGEIRMITLASSEHRDGHGDEVILKIPTASDALKRLEQSSAVLSWLNANLDLPSWSGLMPRVLDEQYSGPHPYVVESIVPGHQAEKALRDPATRYNVLTLAIEKITEFHSHTKQVVKVDEKLLEVWVSEHVAKIHISIGESTPAGRKLTKLAEQLKDTLAGQLMTASWIHGDYSPQNILLDEDNSRITGIVNWERAGPRQLPVLDVLHLLLSTRMLVEGKEFGDIIKPFLEGRLGSTFEHDLIYTAGLISKNLALELRTLVLLTWLQHVAGGGAKQFGNPLWLDKNVRHVIDSARTETAPR